MKTIKNLSFYLSFSLLVACTSSPQSSVFTGFVDAKIIRLTAKTAGTVDRLTCQEGDSVKKGELLVKINDDRSRLQLKQQQARLQEITTNLRIIESKEQQVQSQLNFNLQTLKKTQIMLQQGAATQQQVDQLQTQVDVLRARLQEIQTNKKLIESKQEQVASAIEILRLNVQDAQILAPINGVILNTFVNQYENVAPGSPLLEMADLSHLQVTFYVPLSQLHDVQVGQSAYIKIDGSNERFKGKITWIASEAEFTPKTVLTKETRTSLVYAVKIDVPNPEQKLKIGMPVEVLLK